MQCIAGTLVPSITVRDLIVASVFVLSCRQNEWQNFLLKLLRGWLLFSLLLVWKPHLLKYGNFSCLLLRCETWTSLLRKEAVLRMFEKCWGNTWAQERSKETRKWKIWRSVGSMVSTLHPKISKWLNEWCKDVRARKNFIRVKYVRWTTASE